MDASQKFTNKAGEYSKYRPSYAPDCLHYLANELNLTQQAVADVGCGTGIFTRLLAPLVKTVYAVEPNADMRATCQQQCAAFANILIREGRAEQTGLPDRSVAAVTAVQAFHWFDAAGFRSECRRILQPGGRVALLWNILPEYHPLRSGVRQICAELDIPYSGLNFNTFADGGPVKTFFNPGSLVYQSFAYPLTVNCQQFVGRYLSSSYSPTAQDPRYAEYVRRLTELFNSHQTDGQIILPHATVSYLGQV